MEILQSPRVLSRPQADRTLFRKHIQRELNEIREEVEETCVLADDVEPVPESAYIETLSLLEQMSYDIPIPDMMWLEDGGIGLEWRPGGGIVTMSLYGDRHVVYCAYFSKNQEIAGICPLNETAFLRGFLQP